MAPNNCELILALDLPRREEALALLDRLKDSVQWVKIGLQMFTQYGPDFVREIADLNYKVFLDLKLHDIPNTVAKAVESIALLPVHFLTIHASGGLEMMQWAQSASSEASDCLRLLAVSVLTSMNEQQLHATGVEASPAAQVERLAELALKASIPGMVCSPLELVALRKRFGHAPLLVTPGIRPADSSSDEQKRVMTPEQAAAAGSSYIVVGRPILKASDPAEAARCIQRTLDGSG